MYLGFVKMTFKKFLELMTCFIIFLDYFLMYPTMRRTQLKLN